MDDSKIDQVNDFWYEGEVWGKFYSLEGLAKSAKPKSRIGEQIRDAITSWHQSADADSAILIVQLVIDSMLAEHMPESSTYADLIRADWFLISADTAHQQVDQLAKTKARANGMACECGVQAAEVFKEFSAEATINLQKAVSDSNWIEANVSINGSYCALYFEAL